MLYTRTYISLIMNNQCIDAASKRCIDIYYYYCCYIIHIIISDNTIIRSFEESDSDLNMIEPQLSVSMLSY